MGNYQNISFKKAEEKDLDFLFKLYTSDEVVEQALSPDIKLNNPENLLDTIEFLRDESNGALYIVKNHTKPIGVGIIYDYSKFHQRAKIGISLLKDCTNEGFGSVIFNF